MDDILKKKLSLIANTIRQLSIEAVQKANSGHPGLPMGCAEIGAYLYGVALQHNPAHSHWLARDRFVLSAGHGSMLLYSCLHLAGFQVSLEDIKKFRQLDSLTPGHPEYTTDGVESTTGPLGQGIGNAVGMALGFKILKEKFNTKEFPLFDNKIYTLLGDGCMMEGTCSEASSLAGHWQLDNLIVIYDANKICLDGPISECCSEDTKARYRSYGWDVYEIDGYDLDAMDVTIQMLKKSQNRPAFIYANTIIGKGSPHKAGSHKAHGSPLGEEEVALIKKALHLPEKDFYVPQEVKEYFLQKLKEQKKLEDNWNQMLEKWAKKHPDLYQDFLKMKNKELPKDLEEKITNLPIEPTSGRNASHVVVNFLAKELPFIYGGSADLSCSDMTYLDSFSTIERNNFQARNIKFGVREFAMATISSGLYLTGMITPFCGTFLVFSDYMRNAMRIASLSSWHVIYQLTHDSVFLGEDGPTHQPIEQLAALRAIPNLLLLRPGSVQETKMCWIAALKHIGPTAIVLSRQKLEEVQETHLSFEQGLGKGAYIIKKEKTKKPDYTLFATGSELSLAMKVASKLEEKGKNVRVISFPSFLLFERQEDSYKNSLIEGDLGLRISIEAGSSFGWHKYIGREGLAISIDEFGRSAPIKDLEKVFGFTVEAIVQKILNFRQKA